MEELSSYELERRENMRQNFRRLVSLGLVLSQRLLTLGEAMDAWIEGMKDVLAPMIVLLLAWSLGDVLAKAKAADFLSKALQGSLPKWSLPALISLLAHVISYACGSSFGTMGIILPLVGPLAKNIGGGRPRGPTSRIRYERNTFQEDGAGRATMTLYC